MKSQIRLFFTATLLLTVLISPLASAKVCYGWDKVFVSREWTDPINGWGGTEEFWETVTIPFDPAEWERAGYQFHHNDRPETYGSVNGLFRLRSYSIQPDYAGPLPGVTVLEDDGNGALVRLEKSVRITYNPYPPTDGSKYWHLRMPPNWTFPCTATNEMSVPIRHPLDYVSAPAATPATVTPATATGRAPTDSTRTNIQTLTGVSVGASGLTQPSFDVEGPDVFNPDNNARDGRGDRLCYATGSNGPQTLMGYAESDVTETTCVHFTGDALTNLYRRGYRNPDETQIILEASSEHLGDGGFKMCAYYSDPQAESLPDSYNCDDPLVQQEHRDTTNNGVTARDPRPRLFIPNGVSEKMVCVVPPGSGTPNRFQIFVVPWGRDANRSDGDFPTQEQCDSSR